MKPFKILCGDWIFPARESSTGAKYPIDMPLVVEIYKSEQAVGEQVSDKWQIDSHLQGPRFINISLPRKKTLSLDSLGNEREEMFTSDIGFEIKFKPKLLARSGDLWSGGEYSGKIIPNSRVRTSDWNGIFFTSVLLQAYLDGKSLPDGIVFREATMPEIESLGRWQR